MGQPKIDAQESTNDMMLGYTKNLPDLIKATADSILPMEQAQQNAMNVVAPQKSQLEYDLAKRFLPQFTQLDTDVNRQRAMGQAENDTALLQGPGKDLVRANLEANKIADPEYYKQREQSSDALSKLFGSLDDPNAGLSQTERAEAERSMARTNQARGIEAPTATSAVDSAMNFGNLGNQRHLQKQQAIAAAVQTATQALPTFKSGVDVLQLTTGRPSAPGVATNRFGNPEDTSQNAMSMSQNFLNNIGMNSRQATDINAHRRTPFDSVMQVGNMVGNLAKIGV